MGRSLSTYCDNSICAAICARVPVHAVIRRQQIDLLLRSPLLCRRESGVASRGPSSNPYSFLRPAEPQDGTHSREGCLVVGKVMAKIWMRSVGGSDPVSMIS